MTKCELSVVVPFFNEEKNVKNAADSLVKYIRELNISYEIIMVNNGSSDSTLKIIDKLIKKNKNLKKVDLIKNQGYGGGILSGLKIASGNYIGFIDGDMKFSYENIVKAYKKIKEENVDLCKGVRIRRVNNFKRNMYSIPYNLLVNILFFTNIKDINAKPKLMSKECYTDLNIKSKDWFIDTEIMLKINKKGYKYKDFLLEYKKRKAGVSNIKVSAIIQFLKNLFLFKLGVFNNK